jgi:hypothetical protein
MQSISAANHSVSTLAIGLLAWLSLGPVVGSLLSFFNAMPTQWPALVHFANAPSHWQALFFVSGCLALVAAWLIHRRRFSSALVVAILFASIYVPVFPLVWGQRTIAMGVALLPAAIVGYVLLATRRTEA